MPEEDLLMVLGRGSEKILDSSEDSRRHFGLKMSVLKIITRRLLGLDSTSTTKSGRESAPGTRVSDVL